MRDRAKILLGAYVGMFLANVLYHGENFGRLLSRDTLPIDSLLLNLVVYPLLAPITTIIGAAWFDDSWTSVLVFWGAALGGMYATAALLSPAEGTNTGAGSSQHARTMGGAMRPRADGSHRCGSLCRVAALFGVSCRPPGRQRR